MRDDVPTPHCTLLLREIHPATGEIAARLRISPGRRVLHLRRVRSADHEPPAVLENHLPIDLVNLTGVDFTTTGLYQAMRSAGVQMRVATQQIGAREGTPEECRLLGQPPSSPPLTIDRITHDDTGSPIEWGRHISRPDRYEFIITLIGP